MREEFAQPAAADPAEERVRVLRDAIAGAAGRLKDEKLVRLDELARAVGAALTGLHDDDLGQDDAAVRGQLGAFLNRIEGLLPAHAGYVPASELGLPADARFLDDMTRFITRRFGITD